MLKSSSRVVARQLKARTPAQEAVATTTTTTRSSSRLSYSSVVESARHGVGVSSGNSRSTALVIAALATGAVIAYDDPKNYWTSLAALPTSGDIVTIGQVTKEKATGIAFPSLCNGLTLAGTGVRIKYGFVKVYAVGAYFDPIAMMAVKKASKADIQKALLDPTYPRTIRIVMNRALGIDKYTAAIIESLQPRMKGQDLDKLEEFKKLNPSVDLIEGAEIEMTIRGDTLLYKNATGGVGSIRSRVFTEALCDTYFGADAVSPTLKESVLEGIPKL